MLPDGVSVLLLKEISLCVGSLGDLWLPFKSSGYKLFGVKVVGSSPVICLTLLGWPFLIAVLFGLEKSKLSAMFSLICGHGPGLIHRI